MKTVHRLLAAGTFSLLSLTAATSAFADDAGAPPNRMAKADVTWIAATAEDGMTEVQLSKYAADHATNPDVKAFAAHMVDDHTKANDELKTLATSKGLSLDATLDDKHQGVVDTLTKTDAAAFDAAYMKQMVGDHKTTVARFASEAKAAKDPDLKNWVGKTLPTLRGHLAMAQKTNKEVAKK